MDRPNFSSVGGYRDATAKAVEIVAARQLKELGLARDRVEEALLPVDVMRSPMVDARARAGVSLVFENMQPNTGRDSDGDSGSKVTTITMRSSSTKHSLFSRLSRQNTEDGMALVAKHRMKVPMLGKGSGRGGGQSAYAIAVMNVRL